MMSNEGPGLALSAEDSWKLLGGYEFGRLALSVSNNPDIYPLNFIAHERRLFMRTNPGTKLAEMAVNARVAFEADSVGADEAWSVVAKGTARILELRSEMDAVDKLPLRHWIKTHKWTYVEITPTSITGRRFALGPEPAPE